MKRSGSRSSGDLPRFAAHILQKSEAPPNPSPSLGPTCSSSIAWLYMMIQLASLLPGTGGVSRQRMKRSSPERTSTWENEGGRGGGH